MKEYWHELTDEKVQNYISSGKMVSELLNDFKQPSWCNYPEALSMTMGCWSLCDTKPNGLRSKISHEFCKDCDCYCVLDKKS